MVVTGGIGSFSLFSQPYLLLDFPNTGPFDSGLFPLMYLYDMAFLNIRMSYASAIGYILTVVILIITGLQLSLVPSVEGLRRQDASRGNTKAHWDPSRVNLSCL